MRHASLDIIEFQDAWRMLITHWNRCFVSLVIAVYDSIQPNLSSGSNMSRDFSMQASKVDHSIIEGFDTATST